MGKRSHTDSNDYEDIARKFKKLERMLLRARRKRNSRQGSASSSPSSDSSSQSSSSAPSRSRSASPRPQPRPSPRDRSPLEPLHIEDVPAYLAQGNNDAAAVAPALPSNNVAAAVERAQPSNSAAAAGRPPARATAPSAAPQPSTSQVNDDQPPLPPLDLSAGSNAPAPVDLDEDLLKILGDDPSQIKVYGKNIRDELAVRLQHIATTGLSKESRKELLDKYLTPANSILIDAPTLNPEIKAAVHEHVFKRDKGIEIRQKQLASAISCTAESLTLLMSEQPKNTKLIQLLMVSCKILCDSQNAESIVRRNFILNNLKKELKAELQTTKIDKLLFSQELAEKLKATKAITKSGNDLKAVPSTSAQPTKKNVKPPAKNLNWRGTPQNYRPKTTPRTKEPARKHRRDNSSRTSSRPTSTRSSRR